jgi:hypothetical protein
MRRGGAESRKAAARLPALLCCHTAAAHLSCHANIAMLRARCCLEGCCYAKSREVEKENGEKEKEKEKSQMRDRESSEPA